MPLKNWMTSAFVCPLFQAPTTLAWRPCFGSWRCTMPRTPTTCSWFAWRRGWPTWARAPWPCAPTTATAPSCPLWPWPVCWLRSCPVWTSRTVSTSCAFGCWVNAGWGGGGLWSMEYYAYMFDSEYIHIILIDGGGEGGVLVRWGV